MKKKNVLFLCSDQHNKSMIGCYGNSVVKTPNLDALAEDGVRFTNAYSPNPICVPARACIATGCQGYQIHSWDNASPYTGKYAKSYAHHLEAHDIPVTTIGKLHYRSPEDDTGFKDQRIPLHVRDGIGDLYGTIREYGVVKTVMRQEIPNAHVGNSSYVEYDNKITEEALKFLDGKAEENNPWCLYVGYTFPHLPFITTQETWDLYKDEDIPMPFSYKKGERMEHPSVQDIRTYFGLEEEYEDADIKKAVHTYYGMCTFLDMQIGIVMEKLKELGLDKDTYVIYTTDHGEMMGNHGLWFKNNFLEDSVSIPLIISGPGIPRRKTNNANVSLIDIYPTILDMFNITAIDDGMERHGISLLELAESEDDHCDRAVFSEFHASGNYQGGFMVRYKNYKYISYVSYNPQLFDLNKDPKELNDLAEDPSYVDVVSMMKAKLNEFGKPQEIEAMCRKDQAERLEKYGGKDNILNNFVPIIFSPPPKI